MGGDAASADRGAAASDDPEIEAGRLLFARPARFLTAAPFEAVLPPMRGIEIAVAGRSNVGKSSLVNALTSQTALARTSNTPGRTQELIFFAMGEGEIGERPLTLVDMPGYGYAEAPHEKVQAWTKLIHAYLRGRANLARVYVLVDARHGLKPVDDAVLKTLDSAAVSYQAVLTKADKLSPVELGARIEGIRAALARRPAAFPEIAVTSARTGEGLPELRATIARLIAERSGQGAAA